MSVVSGRGGHRGTSESTRLDQIAEDSRYARGVLEVSTRFSYEVMLPFIRGRRVLEMGPAEGLVTERLATMDISLTVVDGSQQFCDDISTRLPAVEVVCSLFEDYFPEAPFDTIICGHVLEHVESPDDVVAMMKQWLAPDGVIFAAVPNSMSVHRQLAVHMGLLKSENSLNELDLLQGHRRVFSPSEFLSVFERAGLSVLERGGYWFKSVSNSQIEEYYSPSMVDATMKLGQLYPEIAAEIFVVCVNR